MLIRHHSIREEYSRIKVGKHSTHLAHERVRPSLSQYDYLALGALSEDMDRLIQRLPPSSSQKRALDLGSEKSPYVGLLEERNFETKRLDTTTESGPDYVGTVEDTGLESNRFDVVLCTQVLEHSTDPWKGIREIARILKPGGYAVISVPHVWFYHPHPADNWRFTQEGIIQLCRVGEMDLLEVRAQGGTVLALFQILCFSLYGVLGAWGAPIYFALNVVARPLDRLIPNTLFCHNFAFLAQKPLG